MREVTTHVSPYERHLTLQVGHELGHIHRFLTDVEEICKTLQDPEMVEDLACLKREVLRLRDAWEQENR